MGRSRSRSPSRSRSISPYMGADGEIMGGARIHVGDLAPDVSRRDIEHEFSRFGPIYEVWVARNPPCFAFIVFRHIEDGEEAIREMDGAEMCGSRVRVSHARPRSRGRRRRSFDPQLRCYQCGESGHFSRECTVAGRRPGPGMTTGYRDFDPSAGRRRHRSYSRSRSGSPSRMRRISSTARSAQKRSRGLDDDWSPATPRDFEYGYRSPRANRTRRASPPPPPPPPQRDARSFSRSRSR